ncbi:MAG: GNAT family N-acetyltransferase [Actinomycetota bacterium]
MRLRDVAEDDLPIFFDDQRDPEASRMAAFAPRDRDAFMTHCRAILRDPSVVVRTIELDGQVAGNVLVFASAFLDEVRARPLYAGVAEHNHASIRVLEKCGFRVSDEDGPDEATFLLLKLAT